jgi:disulfide oxidoreductase YuzD
MMMESANRNKNNQMFNNLVVVEDSLVAEKSGIISKP